jgi:hypothetical protein
MQNETSLALFVFVEESVSDQELELRIKVRITSQLPFHCLPRKIVILRDQILPTTSHGFCLINFAF